MSEAIDHPALGPGRTAVITGGARGIGHAVALRLARAGMNIAIADVEALDEARAVLLEAGAPQVLAQRVDVAQAAELAALRDAVFERFKEVGLLMNNAAIGGQRGTAWSSAGAWQRTFAVNLIGVANGVCAFAQSMLDSGKPGLIVNTGSKQGMTNPPGDAPYNATKAAVISLTESLAHDLRQAGGSAVRAHLLVPGFTYSSMVRRHVPEKPAAAWWPSQVADAMIEGLLADKFYILCPDNEVTRAMDESRIRWDADDIVKNRPALSRWHPDYAEAFAAWMAGGSDGMLTVQQDGPMEMAQVAARSEGRYQ